MELTVERYFFLVYITQFMSCPRKITSMSNICLLNDVQLAQERALPIGPEEGGFGMSYDLLYGRAGFLWAALFLNKHLGQETVPNDLLMPVVDAVIAGGRAGASDNTACPLMYRWHGTRYFGAANGLAGILHVLLHFPLSTEDAEDVKGTLRYLMSNRFAHSGNYPSSEGNPRDKLVQWSHGATGMALTLCKTSKVSNFSIVACIQGVLLLAPFFSSLFQVSRFRPFLN